MMPVKSVGELAERRQRMALRLSAVTVILYFGFMGLFSFSKQFMGTILVPGLSISMVLGVVVIVSCFVLSLFYVLWTNRADGRHSAQRARPSHKEV